MEESETSAERFDRWVQTATRFFVLANAGGAVAVLSFLGTRSGSGMATGLFAIAALGCFVTGLIVAGIAIMGQLTGAYRAFLSSYSDPIAANHSIERSWVTHWFDKAEPRTGRLLVAAFGLFIFGSGFGLVGLAASILFASGR